MTLHNKLVVNQSISCAEHDELVFYKVGQSLLQTGERITKCGMWQFYYKVGQALQSSAATHYYKEARYIIKWSG